MISGPDAEQRAAHSCQILTLPQTSANLSVQLHPPQISLPVTSTITITVTANPDAAAAEIVCFHVARRLFCLKLHGRRSPCPSLPQSQLPLPLPLMLLQKKCLFSCSKAAFFPKITWPEISLPVTSTITIAITATPDAAAEIVFVFV